MIKVPLHFPLMSSSHQTSETGEDFWPNFGNDQNKPIVCIIVGMAGTGKTTFVQRLNAYVSQEKIPSYFINLDPAVSKLPFKPNIDIRDTISYKDVMSQWKLGPNGGIMTSLNLFATRFDQLMKILDQRKSKLKYIFVDTPGQIEVFNWSASGTIITDSLASTFPTIFIYVADTPRCVSPTTFMSNMLYACSMLYKSRLPMLLAFNKTDVVSHEFCLEWMNDSDSFDQAVRSGGNYMSNLTQSMGLMLQEFYKNMTAVGVSALTGLGMPEVFRATITSAKEYNTEYLPELERRIKEKQEKEIERQREQMEKVSLDLKESSGYEAIPSKARLRPGEPIQRDDYHGDDGNDDGDGSDQEENIYIR